MCRRFRKCVNLNQLLLLPPVTELLPLLKFPISIPLGKLSFVMQAKPYPLHPFSFHGISCSGALLGGQWEADTHHGNFQGEYFRFLDNLLLQLSAEVVLINIPASS